MNTLGCHHPQHGAEPSSTPSWSPPPPTPHRSLPLRGAWLCFHLVCCVCNETVCTPSCLVSFTAFLLSLSGGFAWTLLLNVPRRPPPPHTLKAQFCLPRPPTTTPHARGRLGSPRRARWSLRLPVTLAGSWAERVGGSSLRRRPRALHGGCCQVGHTALCRLGHKPRARGGPSRKRPSSAEAEKRGFRAAKGGGVWPP